MTNFPSAPHGSAVDVVRHDDGGFTIARRFLSPAAAQRAVNDLLAINEAAFGAPVESSYLDSFGPNPVNQADEE